MDDAPLTPEQEQVADQLNQSLQQTDLDETRRGARLMASMPDDLLLQPLAHLAEPLRQAAQVELDRAGRWIALSDGGAGLEDFFQTNFPRVEAVILDCYHVIESVGKLAKALHPADATGADAWRRECSEQLKTQAARWCWTSCGSWT